MEHPPLLSYPRYPTPPKYLSIPQHGTTQQQIIGGNRLPFQPRSLLNLHLLGIRHVSSHARKESHLQRAREAFDTLRRVFPVGHTVRGNSKSRYWYLA